MNWLDQSVLYLKKSKSYLVFAITLFFVTGIIAFFNVDAFRFFDEIIKTLISKIDGLSAHEIIFFIFQNNALSSFSALFFGIFFGIIPFINAVTNGALIGYVVALGYAHTGSLETIWLLVPHGIFELPAIFISIALGMKLGWGFITVHRTFYKKNLAVHRKLIWILVLFFISTIVFAASGQLLSSGITALNSIGFFAGFFVSLGSICMAGVVLFGERALRVAQWKGLRERFNKSVLVFVTIVLPLLVIAALIEGLLIAYF